MTKRETLLKKISTYQFAVLDLQMYIDTHQNDAETLEKVEKYQSLLRPLVEEYEMKYGPLTKSANDGNSWAWIKGPWPWESEDDC